MTEPSPQHLEAWRLFLTAHHEVIDVLSRELEEETGLPLTWYEVLLYLQQAPERRLRMHELADSLLLSRSAMTRFVDRIEEAGYVERRRCVTDRRGYFVALTEEGERIFRRAAPVHVRGIEEHFARHISAEEAESMRRALGRVVDAAPGQPSRTPTTSSTS
jgi:DNA-binding MarR family transcriptional regulator